MAEFLRFNECRFIFERLQFTGAPSSLAYKINLIGSKTNKTFEVPLAQQSKYEQSFWFSDLKSMLGYMV